MNDSEKRYVARLRCVPGAERIAAAFAASGGAEAAADVLEELERPSLDPFVALPRQA